MTDNAFTAFTGLDLEHTALLFDVDGTLIDIGPSPFEVDVPESLKDSLLRLLEKTGGALALVSGRPIRDLDTLFAPLQLPAVGGHGAETRLHVAEAPRRIPDLDASLRRELIAAVAHNPSLAYEDKGYSVALHYRLAPDRAAHVANAVNEVCAASPHAPIEILPGKAVIEIKHAGFSKGTGVRELMTHAPFRGRRPIFIGDDTTDETVFAILPELDGIGFAVGRKVPGTAGCFPAPADVRAWLEQLAPADQSLAS